MKIRGNPSNLAFKRKLRSQMTPAETKLWFCLQRKQFCDLKFRRQHGIGPYIVDFYCPSKNLVIEIDGDVHVSSDDAINKDMIRDDYLRAQGLQVMRYCNNDILKNLNGVLEDLHQRIGGV